MLLAKITPCFENGKLGIAEGLSNGIGFGSSEFLVFRPSASLDKEFLYYFLARPEFRSEGAERMGGAVGHQRVSKEFIDNYRIPLPPLPEQQRIVCILDEAFEGITTAKANAERNLENTRALFESHRQSVFIRRIPKVSVPRGGVGLEVRIVLGAVAWPGRSYKSMKKKDISVLPTWDELDRARTLFQEYEPRDLFYRAASLLSDLSTLKPLPD